MRWDQDLWGYAFSTVSIIGDIDASAVAQAAGKPPNEVARRQEFPLTLPEPLLTRGGLALGAVLMHDLYEMAC